MPVRWALALTDFGNIVVAVPVLAVMLAWLWGHRLRGVALALAINALMAVALTISLKAVSRQAGGAFFGRPWHLTQGAPSGHAAVSMVVYGSIGGILALRGRGLARLGGAGLALLVVAAVDITRVTLGYHSPGDVATGLTLGTMFSIVTLLVAARSRGPWPPMLGVLLSMMLLAAAMQLTGLRFDSTAVL